MTALRERIALPRPPAGTAARVLEDTVMRRRSRLRARRRVVWLARVGILAGVIVAWELSSGTLVRTFFVSRPEAVAARLVEWTLNGDLLWHGQFTLTATFVGYLVGAFAAILLAWPLGLMPRAYRVAEPYILLAYSIPAVALGPVFILWFGLELLPKIILAAYFVFFVVFINTVAGFRQVPPGLIDVSLVMGASRAALFRTVILPSAVPYMLAALRATLPAAMIGAVVGEFIASNRGLGYLASAAASEYETDGVIAAALVMAVIVLALTVLLRPLGRVTRWQRGVDVGEGGL